MKRTILPCAALCGLALFLGASVEAAPPIKIKPLCPTPTVASCTDPSQQACMQANLETCKSLVDEAWTDDPAFSSAEIRPMLRPGAGTDIPKDLRKDGRFYPYVPNKKQVLGRARNRGLSVTRAIVPPPPTPSPGPVPAKVGHRNPKWDENGPLVTSCEEYAYESIYDWGRFVDSDALCEGDGLCTHDLAMMKSTPGLAHRKLVRRDDVALSPQLELRKGVSDKNVMYAIDPSWVYVNGNAPLAATPELLEMEADLKAGKGFRAIACPACKATEKHADEWAYHQAMRTKLAPVSLEEFEEYDRRRAEFERLVGNWARAVQAELQPGIDKANGMRTLPPLAAGGVAPDPGPLQRPWELMIDPVQRQQAIVDFEAHVRKAKRAPRGRGSRANAPGFFYVAPSTASPWGQAFAPSAGPINQPRLDPKVVKGTAGLPPGMGKHVCLPSEADGPAVARQDVHACALAVFLREEWLRKKRGQRSCLDPSNHTCDWSPTMFRSRALGLGEKYLSQQQHLQDECVAITRTGKLPKIPLSEVPAHLAGIQKALGAANQALAAYQLEPKRNEIGGRRFGTSKSGSDHFGVAGLFRSGYEYQLGWGIEPAELSSEGLACRLEGDTNNSLKVTAGVFESDFTLLDAGLAVRANQGGDGRVHLKTHVTMLGEQLLGSVDKDITQLFDKKEDLFRRDTPHVGFTFMAGFVPITVAGWGQLEAGYRVHGEGHFATQCQPENPEFGLVASFTPTVAANAQAQVGVGITGFSVGMRGTMNLLTVGFPLEARFGVELGQVGKDAHAPLLRFNAGLDMTLATLAGRLAIYAEALVVEHEWELFSWTGLGPYTIELMKLFDVKLPLIGMS